jgi:hypothetical protein
MNTCGPVAGLTCAAYSSPRNPPDRAVGHCRGALRPLMVWSETLGRVAGLGRRSFSDQLDTREGGGSRHRLPRHARQGPPRPRTPGIRRFALQVAWYCSRRAAGVGGRRKSGDPRVLCRTRALPSPFSRVVPGADGTVDSGGYCAYPIALSRCPDAALPRRRTRYPPSRCATTVESNTTASSACAVVRTRLHGPTGHPIRQRARAPAMEVPGADADDAVATLVLCHGAWRAAGYWHERLAQRLAERGISTLAPSLRGHAGSAPGHRLNQLQAVGIAFCLPKTSGQSGARKETDKESIGLLEMLA